MRALVVTVLTVCSLGVGLTSPAYAEKHVADDPAGDVIRFDSEAEGVDPAPSVAESDIVKSWVKHGRTRLVVTLRLRDLTPATNYDSFVAMADVRSDSGRSYATLLKFGGTKAGLLLQGDAGPRNCRRARLDFRASEDIIRMALPRRCLGNPSWVKVGLTAVLQDDGFNFSDDALGKSHPQKDPQPTPRLRRG